MVSARRAGTPDPIGPTRRDGEYPAAAPMPSAALLVMSSARAIVVVDLAFGDCGKGTVVDHLVRELGAGVVVRFNGGPQAAHNVVTPDGRHHTFSQFGSGTFVPGVRTVLSRFVLVEPYALLNEATALAMVGVPDALDRLVIDPRCVVITPAHRAANRLRERSRGSAAHGTCGIGFGEAVADSIARPDLTLRAGELADRAAVSRKLAAVARYKAGQLAALLDDSPDADALRRPAWVDEAADVYTDDRIGVAPPAFAGPVVFEGAQGVLLDETHGFQPHTTWSTTTFANADAVLDEAGWRGPRHRLGVLRSYFTRHGAGPLVTADGDLKARLPEPHNDDRGHQGVFRVGPFDVVAARYAVSVAGRVDGLAVTHLDRLSVLPPVLCTAYDPPVRLGPDATAALNVTRPVYEPIDTADPAAFAERVGALVGVPVELLSFGPTAADKRRRGKCGTGVSPACGTGVPPACGTGVSPVCGTGVSPVYS